MTPPSAPAIAARRGDADARGAHAARPAPAVRSRAGWHRTAATGLVLTVAAAVLGLVMAVRLGGALRRNPDLSVFYRFFAGHEPAALAVLLAFALAGLAALALGRGARADAASPVAEGGWSARPLGRGPTLALAAVVTLVAAIGTRVVMRQLPLSGDEYSVVYQARLLARGMLAAPLPAEWRAYVDALVPAFVAYVPALDGLVSLYLPVNAAVRAAFELVGLGSYTNAVLAGCTILALAAVARRLWPDDGRAARLAVLALAVSPQFLLMSMTAYAMPPHLLANVLWLALYVARTRTATLLLPVVGVLALGLHNPFPHALFVTPFLVRLLRERRFRMLGYVAAVYALGCAAWIGWYLRMHPVGGAPGGLASVFGLPDLGSVKMQGAAVLLLLAWNVPFLALGGWVVLRRWAEQPTVIRDLVAGVVLTLGFHLFFPSDPHHGWGYRYAYGSLGALALVATQGLTALAGEAPAARAFATRLAVLGLATTALVLVPLRLGQAGTFVRPHAAVHAWLRSRDAAVVVVPDSLFDYGIDLSRNTPAFDPPVVLRGSALPPGAVAELRRRYGPRLEIVAPAEIGRRGWRELAVPRAWR